MLGGDTVIQRVSFTLHRGEITAIVGPNGSGKNNPSAGAARSCAVPWENCVATGDFFWLCSAAVFDSASTPITAGEFILLKSERFWMPRKDFLDHLTHELDLVGVDQTVLGKPRGQLSGGKMQRLLVSRAMLNHPDVLLFDEPTAAVDKGSRRPFMRSCVA